MREVLELARRQVEESPKWLRGIYRRNDALLKGLGKMDERDVVAHLRERTKIRVSKDEALRAIAKALAKGAELHADDDLDEISVIEGEDSIGLYVNGEPFFLEIEEG